MFPGGRSAHTPGTGESARAAIEPPSGQRRLRRRPSNGTLTIERLPRLVPEGSGPTFIFLVDGETLARDGHPVPVVDLFEVRGRTFRVVPSQMWSVENDLSLGNMDREDFAGHLDADGDFRGFPR